MFSIRAVLYREHVSCFDLKNKEWSERDPHHAAVTGKPTEVEWTGHLAECCHVVWRLESERSKRGTGPGSGVTTSADVDKSPIDTLIGNHGVSGWQDLSLFSCNAITPISSIHYDRLFRALVMVTVYGFSFGAKNNTINSWTRLDWLCAPIICIPNY